MKTIGTTSTHRGATSVEIGRYPVGGAIHITLYYNDSDAWACPATFSVNLRAVGCQVADNEFNVKTSDGMEDFVAPMLASGLFEDTGRSFSGYVFSPIWRLRDPAHVPEPLKPKKRTVASA